MKWGKECEYGTEVIILTEDKSYKYKTEIELYNIHNGYYTHTIGIYIYQNGKLLADEQDL